MAKIARYMLIFLLSATAVACISLFVACAPEVATDGPVEVNGKIVFDCDYHDEFTHDITLSFTPVNGSVDGVSAAVTYVDSSNKTVTKSGFTIDEVDGKYCLCADKESSYNLDLKWDCDNPDDNYVTLYGDFIVSGVINDYEDHSEGERHYVNTGHFGAGDVVVSPEEWFFHFEDFEISQTEYLSFYISPLVYSAGILDKDVTNIISGDPNLRNLHWMNYRLDDGSVYGIYDFLVMKENAMCLQVYRADYFAANRKESVVDEVSGDKLNFGKCIYSSAVCDAEEGDTAYMFLEKSNLQLPDGTYVYTGFPSIKCETGENGEWVLYTYWHLGRSMVSLYVELDAEGQAIPQSLKQVERNICAGDDYAADYIYYYEPSADKYLVWRMLDFGTFDVEDGVFQSMDATIEEVDDNTFEVTAGGRTYHVSIDMKSCYRSGEEYITHSIIVT